MGILFESCLKRFFSSNNEKKDEISQQLDDIEIESYKFENDERYYVYYKSGPNEIERLKKELGENSKIVFIDDLNLSKNIPVGLENLGG